MRKKELNRYINIETFQARYIRLFQMNQIASRKNENEHVPMFSVVDKNDYSENDFDDYMKNHLYLYLAM